MSAQRAAQLVEAGHWLQMSGDVEGARRLFEQALKLDPGNARAQQLLASARPFQAPVPPPAPAAPGAMRWQPLAEPMPPRTPVEIPEAAPADDPDVPLELPPPGPPPSPLPDLSAEPVVRPIRFAPNATSAWDSQSNPGVHLQDASPGLGDAMDLVSEDGQPPAEAAPDSSKLREEVETLLQGARDLLELDDHTGAMELILKAEQLAPADPDVVSMRERSEKTLQTMFESKLGEMSSRPRVLLKEDEIIWLNLDHRAGFVLAQIDGTVSFEDLFEVCGMSRLDTARILAQLIEEGVISAS